MQDPRLRLFSIVVLSIAAFASVAGAVAALIWWLIFTPRTKVLPQPGVFLALTLMIAITALVSELGDGPGISYLIRMIVILLIAAWAYTETREGEMLAVAVWAFGDRIGFEIGLIAEMGLQGLLVIRQDIEQVKVALAIKGTEIGARSIAPIAILLIITEIRRANDLARLLVVRGYTLGGQICPVFESNPREILAALLAVVPGVLCWIPVRDVFILVQ